MMDDFSWSVSTEEVEVEVRAEARAAGVVTSVVDEWDERGRMRMMRMMRRGMRGREYIICGAGGVGEDVKEGGAAGDGGGEGRYGRDG